jgi:uncharacterized cupredoxin-like copper-binding protein
MSEGKSAMTIRQFLMAGFASAVLASTALHGALAGAGHAGGFAFGKPGTADTVTRTINVDMQDMAYSIKKIKVREGETIRFVLVNSDEAEHDFTLGPSSLQAQHRKEMADMMDKDMDMSKHHADPNARFLNPGETKELIWTFAEFHELEFACNVPGHYEAGMKGEINVVHGH